MLALGGLLLLESVPAAVIQGSVELRSRSMSEVNLSAYEGRRREIPKPPPTRAAVWVPRESTVETGTDTPSEPATLAQQNTHFRPPILPVQVGQSVQFPNRDDEYHNVFSYSDPRRFDLGRYLMVKDAPSIQFDQPGIVKVYCDIHDWMRATILVLETPYLALTNKKGEFVLRGIPPGSRTVRVRTSNGRQAARTVRVTAGDTTRVSIQPENPEDD